MGRRWALPLCGFLLACADQAAAPGAAPELAENEQAIVYGQDDRREVYQEPSEVRELARNAVLGMVHRRRLTFLPTGEVKLSQASLGSTYDLCLGERFRDQPTTSDCTAVLIDDDLVLTAGHCLEDVECTDYYFVFDYFYRAEKQLEPIGAADVYGCRKLVAHEISARNGRQVDYAVVQLDRPARDRKPLAVSTGALQVGQPLLVLGTGSGLPIKADQGASVLEPRSLQNDFFMLEADTFEGSSGSAILDAERRLHGVLVRGGEDYVTNDGENCRRVNRLERASLIELPRGALAHEEATYAGEAVAGACAAGFPSVPLCDIEPRCGDTYCTADESRESCSEDCDPCVEGACGARGSLPAGARDAVKQGAGSGRAARGGCALGAVPRAAESSAPWWLVAAALFGWRRRRPR